VPIERAEAFFDGAENPKELQTYEVGHSLNAGAMRDRVGWVSQQMLV